MSCIMVQDVSRDGGCGCSLRSNVDLDTASCSSAPHACGGLGGRFMGYGGSWWKMD